MRKENIKFITGERAILTGRNLIVADLHLGIEYEYYQNGITMPSQTKSIIERLDSIIKSTNAKRLFILGDIKHKVPGTSFQEKKEIPDFFDHLRKKINTEIIPGNHDADVKFLVPKIKIHPSKGVLVGKYYLTHGHALPAKSAFRADYIITGHNHPAIEFSDNLGYKWRESVWVRAPFSRNKLKQKFSALPKKLPELIIMPPFNRFTGGFVLNRKKQSRGYGIEKLGLGPLTKAADMKKSRIYLVDGTYLGLLGRLTSQSS